MFQTNEHLEGHTIEQNRVYFQLIAQQDYSSRVAEFALTS